MNGQRALWTFLFFTLIGPFIAAIGAALYTPVAIWANLAPYTAGDHAPFDWTNLPDGAGVAQLMAGAALQAFVWAPIAAAVAALGLVVLLFTRGEVGWALAGAAGVVGFFAGYIYSPFDAGALLPFFAIGAGIAAALLSRFLVGINVLPEPT
ncbi:MAG: hypothetical protein ACR2PI_09125 [Hyphomicrobiaceae bacterium]